MPDSTEKGSHGPLENARTSTLSDSDEEGSLLGERLRELGHRHDQLVERLNKVDNTDAGKHPLPDPNLGRSSFSEVQSYILNKHIATELAGIKSELSLLSSNLLLVMNHLGIEEETR